MICRATSSGSSACHLLALRVRGDFARERGVAGEETLRQVEQRLPELVLDPRRAARVLDVLRDQRAAQALACRGRRGTPPRAPAACAARALGRACASSARTLALDASGSLPGSEASQRSADLRVAREGPCCLCGIRTSASAESVAARIGRNARRTRRPIRVAIPRRSRRATVVENVRVRALGRSFVDSDHRPKTGERQ